MSGQSTSWQSDSLIASFRRMLMAAGDYRGALKRSFLFTIVAAVLEGLALAVLFPLLEAVFTLGVTSDEAVDWLLVMAGIAALEALVRWHANHFSYSSEYADISHSLRIRLGEQLRRIPLMDLERYRTGELTDNLAGNVDEVLAPMGAVSALIIRTLVVPLVVIVVMLFVDWRLALLFAAIFPVMLPLYRHQRAAYRRSKATLAEAHAHTAAEILEYTQGVNVLRSANSVGERAHHLTAAFDQLEQVQIASQKKGTLPNLMAATLVEGGLWLVAMCGLYWVLTGSLALATFIAAMVITTRFSETLTYFINMTSLLDMMERGLKRLEALFGILPLPVTQPTKQLSRFDITFDKVCFGYGDRQTVLDGMSFALPQHSMTALVGASGSGKTTITRLLMRYADPDSGTIRIGGTELTAVNQEHLMSHISVVFQDVYLFDDTILNNIRMSRPDANDEQVEQAARQACCHEFIERLPEGYHTRVGDIGGRLSGGEKQRVSIARAILKGAPIVILDEVTAALDTESEVAVQRAINQLIVDRTVIVIAHRLSTITGADRILVINDGKVAEQGNHHTLLRRNGRYRQLWRAQESLKSWQAAR